MIKPIEYGSIPQSLFVIYYSIVTLFLVYTLLKYKFDLLNFVIILIFFDGLFDWVSSVSILGTMIWNFEKLAIFVLPLIYIHNNRKKISIDKKEKRVIIWFILTTISLIITYINIKDPFNSYLRQYSKISNIFLFFIIFKMLTRNTKDLSNIYRLLLDLLKLQIIFSLFKIIIFGGIFERLVGSVSGLGAGVASLLPVFGFTLIWLKFYGRLTVKNWVLIGFLLLIGIASDKRAIWFITPVFIFYFNNFLSKRRSSSKIIKHLLFIPVFFAILYIGIRITPSLNKDNKIGGDFDLPYAIEYAQNYTFGSKYGEEYARGRGASTFYIISNLTEYISSIKGLFGDGTEVIFGTNYKDFDALKYGVVEKGSAGGAMRFLIAYGFVGMTFILIFGLVITSSIENKKIKYFFLMFFLWEYFFYQAYIFHSYAGGVLFVFLINYSKRIPKNFLLTAVFTLRKNAKINTFN